MTGDPHPCYCPGDSDPEQRKWNPRRIIQWLEGRAGTMDGGARL